MTKRIQQYFNVERKYVENRYVDNKYVEYMANNVYVRIIMYVEWKYVDSKYVETFITT